MGQWAVITPPQLLWKRYLTEYRYSGDIPGFITRLAYRAVGSRASGVHTEPQCAVMVPLTG